MLNDFINSNYSHASWRREIGVHHFHCYSHGKNGRVVVNCFVVKVPGGQTRVKTIGKYKTKQEAEKAFLGNTLNWNKPIPYYEMLGDKRLKSYK